MRVCPECGAIITDPYTTECPECGAPLSFEEEEVKTCPECGAIIEDPDAMVCPECGAPLPETGEEEIGDEVECPECGAIIPRRRDRMPRVRRRVRGRDRRGRRGSLRSRPRGIGAFPDGPGDDREHSGLHIDRERGRPQGPGPAAEGGGLRPRDLPRHPVQDRRAARRVPHPPVGEGRHHWCQEPPRPQDRHGLPRAEAD
ncbi:MAG TPA: zinc-ribbon domain-containing protein [Thermoplasmata archaeon]|nr:zinc-ribbon domain-containing protein [Thermoplasmata archaeon]